MDDFEEFTRDRIARLRAEADALDKTLKEYLSAKNRQVGQTRRSGPDQPRSGAFGVVMEAIANAGPEGLTLDQMIDAAAAEGFTVKRNTLRSQVWQAKNDSELVALEAGRYRAASATPSSSPRADDDTWGQFSSPAAVRKRERPATFQQTVGTMRPSAESDDLDDEIPF